MNKILRRILGSVYGRMRTAYYNERYDFFRKQYHIRSNFGFNGTDIRIYGEGTLELGEDSYIGSNSTIELYKGRKVVIGKRCQISHNVRIYTSTAFPNQDFTIDKALPDKTGDIIIGDGVWIGANVFINPGIIIGDNAVIGANSVVTKKVLSKSIVGGIPATLIRMKEY